MSTDDSSSTEVQIGAIRTYLLLDGPRWLVVVGILSVFFVAVLGLVAIDPAPLEGALESGDTAETLFQSLVTAIVTGVTLVVSINSLVISQELGALGDQRERMGGSLEFRDDAADLIDEPVSPMAPAAFLQTLLERCNDRAGDLARAVEDVGDESMKEAVSVFVGAVQEDAERGIEDLEGEQFGTFAIVSAALEFGYSVKIQQGKRIAREYEDQLDDAAADALDDVLTAMQLFGPAREHIKTLYVQWELVNLSRGIVYAAIPALIVSIGALLTLDNPGSVAGRTLGVANASWLIVGAATVSVTPFAILLAYIVRVATVIKRTLAIGPFVLRELDDDNGTD